MKEMFYYKDDERYRELSRFRTRPFQLHIKRKDIRLLMHEYFPLLEMVLVNQYQANERECELCMLLMADYRTSEISLLWDMNWSSVSQVKKRLKMKMGIADRMKDTLSIFVKRLVGNERIGMGYRILEASNENPKRIRLE